MLLSFYLFASKVLTLYFSISSSFVMIERWLFWACTISIRSNGSLCNNGSFSIDSPSIIVTSRAVNPFFSQIEANFSGASSLPIVFLIDISHREIGLTYISFSGLLITCLHISPSFSEFLSHQSKTRVSKR